MKQRPPETSSAATTKPGLHPRNPHRARYDFESLVAACPELGRYVRSNPFGAPSIEFADPDAVRALNRALLLNEYGIKGWELPARYLCPPIPGRADYVHHLADLLAEGRGGNIPRGSAVRVLDIGVGANGVYPLVGYRSYGWRFLGTDVDPGALANLSKILSQNPDFETAIELRLQKDPSSIFEGVIRAGETFDACLCNPPFHASPEEAREGTARKWRNLGRGQSGVPGLNFGGRGAELWCPGGEAAFIGRMIAESVRRPTCCRWFTSLVSKAANLPALRRALRAVDVRSYRIIDMAHGQKKSRVLAWTFQD